MNDQDVKRCPACGKVLGFCDCPMPKTEPMTPEAFAYDLACGVAGHFTSMRGGDCSFNVAKAKETIKLRIAQRDRDRDRDILTKEAERFCDQCDLVPEEELCPGKNKCWRRKAILAPLDKTDKGE